MSYYSPVDLMATGHGDREVTEARRHLASILADPTIIGAIAAVAATKGRELLALRPSTTADESDQSDDEWLLDEVLDALEDLAREPSDLEAALIEAYHRAPRLIAPGR